MRYGGAMELADGAELLVRTWVQGRIGRIRLNRPGKINALNLEMIAAVRQALGRWRDAAGVVAVVIDGEGPRGLCAGGDIAAVYDGIRGDLPAPHGFWADEYRMNLEIAEYPKPVVSVMHGITFGGGIGIAGHASVRVVTESSQLAMPETAIGLAPDVGGLYLLARAPGEFGTFAALTGARLGASDALMAGLADYFVPAPDVATLPDLLADARISDDVSAVVRSVAAQPAASGHWPSAQPWIDACFAGDDAREMLSRLRSHPHSAARAVGTTLAEMSPTAVAVTLRALRRARDMSLAEVLQQDLMLSVRFAGHPDFPEGIRAQIIDKDRSPRWSPRSLNDVIPGDIDAFFAPLPLELTL